MSDDPTQPTTEAEAAAARRARGIDMMQQVYGWDIGEVHGDFLATTVDHLFGEVWARDGLTVKERRLLLLGMLAGTGQHDVIGLQLDAALRLDELTPAELEDIVLLVAHYAGWPVGARLNQTVTELLARHAPPTDAGGDAG